MVLIITIDNDKNNTTTTTTCANRLCYNGFNCDKCELIGIFIFNVFLSNYSSESKVIQKGINVLDFPLMMKITMVTMAKIIIASITATTMLMK